MILVVGATGLLGSELVRRLRVAGHTVRALARQTSNPARLESVRQTGAEVVYGDLKDAGSLRSALAGIEDVITTASSTLSRQPGDSIATVDREGYFTLIDCARAAGVRRFIYTSIPQKIKFESPLSRAKQEVAEYLGSSGMDHTVLAANYFMEVWLSPLLGFDPENARATVYGAGDQPIGFVSYKNVAEIAARSLEVKASRNRTIPVGGPTNPTALEVVQIFATLSGRKFSVEHIAAEALEEKRRSAQNPLDESFAALMLDYASGCPMDMRETLSMFPIQLTSVRDYANSVLQLESARA